MNGNVRKRGSKWYYSFEAARVNGKRQRIERVGGNTKGEALEALRNALNEYDKGGLIDLSDISVSDYFDYWFKNYVEKNLKYNTQINYKNIIAKYIKPTIGKYKLKSIGPAKLQDLVNELPDKGLAKHTTEIVVTVMKGAFKKAVYPWMLIKENPMIYVEMPKYDQQLAQTRDDLRIITLEQYFDILAFLGKQNSFYIPFLIGFHTGMRRGEVCGLTWDKVSLSQNTITVDKIMINGKNGIELGTPKTQSSYRTISIDDVLSSELKEHKKRQMENKLLYGKHYTDSNFVCTKTDGDLVTPNSIKWSGENIKKKLGINFGFHSLRHTHATMLLEEGAKDKAVQARLGHSRISTTMDKYAHVTQKMNNETVDLFANKLRNGRQLN